jgi:hypothetical protein
VFEILESRIPENDVAMARFLRYAGLFETVHCSFPWTPSTLIMFIDYRCSLRFLWNWKVSYGVTSVGLSVANGTPLYVHYFGYPLASSLLPSSS